MIYSNTVNFEVYGDYALFSEPATRVGGEKCSYQIPTYEAIKGILHSIYWKPTFIWNVEKVRVMNPIQMETKGIRPIKYHSDKNDLSYYTYLKDCRYQVEASFTWNQNRPELEKDRNEHKHFSIANRMVERGGRRDIYIGTRECQGYVVPCKFGEGKGHYDDIDQLSFGHMYHGITYADEAYSEETRGKMTINFWNPVMRNGVIEFISPIACEHRPVKEMQIKKFGEELDNFTMYEEWEEVL